MGTIHNGGCRAAPAHGLCSITTLRSVSPFTLDGVAAYMAKTFPGDNVVYMYCLPPAGVLHSQNKVINAP
jgi:hypothetical protein